MEGNLNLKGLSQQGQAHEFVMYTRGYQMDLFRLLDSKPFFDNVLIEHGGLTRVLPLAVHLVRF